MQDQTTGLIRQMFFDSDADNTAQALLTSAGYLFKLEVSNSNATAAYVQLFDAATTSVTVGSTTPNYVIFVPPDGAVISDFDDIAPLFLNAITYAATTTATGSGDPTTGLVLSAIYGDSNA